MNRELVYTAIDDTSFQNWCVQHELIVPSEVELPTVIPFQSHTVAGRVWEVLAHNPKRIISHRRIVSALEEQRVNEQSIRSYIFRLRRALNSSVDVQSWYGVGYSVGVEKLHLPPTELAILYTLWKHSESAVTLRYLAYKLHSDISDASIIAVRESLYDLHARFRYRPRPRITYTDGAASLNLIDPNEFYLPVMTEYLPEYLDLPFQHWLRKKKVNLIQITDTAKLIQPGFTTARERQLHKIFTLHPHTFIPTSYLIHALEIEGVNPLNDLRKIIFDYRSKWDDPDVIQNSVEVGYSFGAKLLLTKFPLIMLRALWSSESGMTKEDVCSFMQEQGLEITPYTFTRNFTLLNRALEDNSHYRIKRTSDMKYQLVH